MNTWQIRCFLETAAQLNFSKAAAALYISQPVLSRKIVALEDELGFPLFIRTTRSIKLTPAGEALYDFFAKTSLEYEQLYQKLINMTMGMAKRMSIANTKGNIVDSLCIPAIESFKSALPQVQCELHSVSFEAQNQGLVDGTYDIALMGIDPKDLHPKLSYLMLRPLACYIGMSKNHPMAKSTSATLKDFKDDCLLNETGGYTPSTWNGTLHYFSKHHIAPANKTVESLHELFFYIEAGQGISVFTDLSIQRDHPNIVFLPETEPLDFYLAAAYKSQNDNPAIKYFLDLLKEAYQL